MKNKIVATFLVTLLVSSGTFETVAAAGCPYQWEFDECMEANRSWSPRSITGFICIASESPSEVMYNIVLDKKFKDIDKEIEQECSTLEKSKDYYFWANQRESFFKGLDLISKNFGVDGVYWEKYNKVCDQTNEDGILQTTMQCLWGSTPFDTSKDFFSQNKCIGLAEVKLAVARQVMYNTMKLNKMAVRRDEKKTFFQSRRKRYSELLDILNFNISFVERIASKWNAKIKNNCY